MWRERLDYLLEQSEPKSLSKRPKIALYLIVMIVIVAGIHWSVARLTPTSHTNQTAANFWLNLKNLVWGRDLLSGESADRVNILLMGIGGVGHDGPYLTDSILLVSLKPSNGQVSLLSIPRDLWVPIPEVGHRRINEADAIGEKVDPGNGADLARRTVAELLQLDVPYYVRLDFDGFAKIIDDLGGITITVGQSFVDTEYPTNDFKTQTISFTAGTQHFSGEEALKFVRSRHGSNGEASDFARSHRQMLVLAAIKDKILSRATLLNPNSLLSTLTDISDHVSTNLATWQLVRLSKIGSRVERERITSVVLDDSPSGYLKDQLLGDGAFVLTPKSDSFIEIRDLAAHLLDSAVTSSPSENARLVIQNGTGINGLALATAQWLKDQGFVIVSYGNAEHREISETLVYDLTQGKKPQALRLLQEKLNAKTLPPPPDLEAPADFIIILGPPPPDHPLSAKSQTT